MRRWTILVLGMGLLFLAGRREPGNDEWQVVQLTDCSQGKVFPPCVSQEGEEVFFISTCDVTGRNPDHSPEIFKWEEGKITQLTSVDHCTIDDLALSPDASRLAFISNCSFTGKNLGRSLELVVRDNASGELWVLTESVGYLNRSPAWSPDGQSLVFISTADLKGQNPDHSPEVFLVNWEEETGAQITQVSQTRNPLGCQQPALIADTIVALCDEDFPGTAPPPDRLQPQPPPSTIISGGGPGGNPDHNHELVSFSFSGAVRQLTFTQGCEIGAFAVSKNGALIAFGSDCNLTQKQMVNRQPNLYFLSSRLFMPFPDYSFPLSSMSFSGDSQRLALSSSFSQRSVNSEANYEIILVTLGGNRSPLLSFVTDFSDGASEYPALNQEGRVIVFTSTANPFGRNNDHSAELFMATQLKSEAEGATEEE